MAITPQQAIERQKYLGSSDAAAVLGLDPYRSAADIWLEKTGRATGFGGNEATERGSRLESVLLHWASDKLDGGNRFLTDRMVVHPSGLLACNLDAISFDDTEIIEAKTTVLDAEWGDEGTDEVPDRVLVQVHHQFVCVPTVRIAWVPVLLPGFRSFDWRLYRVTRNDELAETIAARGTEFMERYVRTDTPPDDYRPTMEVLKRVRREPGKIVTIPDVAVSLWQQAQARHKVTGEELERAAADVIGCIGDAEGATCTLGTLTYMETTRKGYAVEPTTYRSLRFKKAKEMKG